MGDVAAHDLSPEELQQLISLLDRLQPGFLPLEVFLQVSRLVATPIIEVVPVRKNQGKTEILLLPRDADDHLWPGEVHTPGRVIRATDDPEYVQAGVSAIIADELGGAQLGPVQFVQTVFHASRRGAEFAQIYWAEVIGSPSVGEFFDAQELPHNLIQSQQEFITLAVASFEAA